MSLVRWRHPVVLASASPIRHQMLLAAHIPHKIMPSPFDEEQAKQNTCAGSIPELALSLAQGKAEAVSQMRPECLVIGADQMGEFEGQALTKPGSPEANVALLMRLVGHAHQQHSACSVYFGKEEVFRYVDTVQLTMRPLSRKLIEAYVQEEQAWMCSGGYRYEGWGRHLFDSLSGHPDSVMGLPLTPMLNALYEAGFCEWH